MDTSDIKWPSRRKRGRYSNEFKQNLIAACATAGVSTASIALANGINANLLRRWVAEAREPAGIPDHGGSMPHAVGESGFVRLDAPTSPHEPRIELQLQRGELRLSAHGSASECAAFVRALCG